DLLKMLPDIWNHPAPSYVRINTRKTDYVHAPFEIGKAEIIAEGSDVTILTYGLLFEQTLEAVKILKEEGLSVGLINMRSLKPVDEDAILKAAESNMIVTVEDHFLTGGLFSIVAETLLKHQTTAQVVPFALNEKWFKPSLLPQVLEHEG